MNRGVLMIALYSLWFSPANAQDAVSCKQTDEILSELRELRKLIETKPVAPSAPRAATATIAVGDAPFIGSADAPVTLVEFTDYQCPYCRKFHTETFPELKKAYMDSGKVRFYVMDLPLDVHKNARIAAQASRCALEQGKFWEMRDWMQANGESLELDKLASISSEFGMDDAAFRQCVESGRFKDAVEQSVSEAAAKGIRATPSFVVGKSTAAGVDGDVIVGAVPLATFERAIDELLK
jgi:protein-disulfide isomerase